MPITLRCSSENRILEIIINLNIVGISKFFGTILIKKYAKANPSKTNERLKDNSGGIGNSLLKSVNIKLKNTRQNPNPKKTDCDF